jgi:release factor glutamine methyltransferase
MNIAQTLERAAAMGLDRLDAQLLLLQAIGAAGANRAWLIAHDSDDVAPEVDFTFLGLCERRAEGEPVAYLVGSKEFFGLDLMVDQRVLVPRPDTETLVEWALTLVQEESRVIDLGTGSGAIALAIKKNRPGATVEAVDISSDALEVAGANSRAHGLSITLHQGSWLQGIDGRYDLIVSNPPYVACGDPHLKALRHEPLQALASGDDGLSDIRAIAEQSPSRLKPGGWLLLEHGHDQSSAVTDILAAAGFAQVSRRRDLAGIERCSGGKWLELG